MGVLYGVKPLTAKLKKLLAEDGITCPEGALGRFATPREIRAAASGVDEFIAEFNGEDNFDQVDIHSHALWRARVEGPFTYTRLEMTDQHVARLRELSERCGGWIMYDLTKGEMFVPMEKWTTEMYDRKCAL